MSDKEFQAISGVNEELLGPVKTIRLRLGAPDLYDKQGFPITMEEWGRLLNEPFYARIGEWTSPEGHWVSTVWLGLNHAFFTGRMEIFETMIFETLDSMNTLFMARYSTLEEAEAGHKFACENYKELVSEAYDP